MIIKNNILLLKSLERKKKDMISDHVNLLKNQYKKIGESITEDYENYFKSYMIRIKIIDRIYSGITKIIKNGVLKNTDNMLSLIMPYFYIREDNIIEEYGRSTK
jgi:hypothetical protein